MRDTLHIEGTSKLHRINRPAECGVCLARACFPEGEEFRVASKLAPRVREAFPLVYQERVAEGGVRIWIPKIATVNNEPRPIPIRQEATSSVPWKSNISGDPLIGRVLRLFWIDELPQVGCFLRDQIKLIGIRPKTVAEFMLLPNEHQELITKAKPGWANVLYAFDKERLKTPEGVMSAEAQYLREYAHSPRLTDFFYAMRILFRIASGQARGV